MSEHTATIRWTRLHHAAHEQCFIANSIKTEVTVATPADEASSPSGTGGK